MSDTHTDTNDTIRRIAWEVRLRLERHWGWTGDPQVIVGTCRDTSHDLARRLMGAGIAAEPCWCAYLDADPDYAEAVRLGGMEDEDDERLDGFWSHWVVVCGTTLIDVTQDQFYPNIKDHERVVISDTQDSKYRLIGNPGEEPAPCSP